MIDTVEHEKGEAEVLIDNLDDNDKRDILVTIEELKQEYRKIDDASYVIDEAAKNIKDVFGIKTAAFKKFAKITYENNLKEAEVKATDVIKAYKALTGSL